MKSEFPQKFTKGTQLCWGTILWEKSVQPVHHYFRFKWKKEMQNEYPHDIPGW